MDVVGDPEILDRRGAGKGILLARFEGGNQIPIATTRVYFTTQGSSFGTALPSFVTGPVRPDRAGRAGLGGRRRSSGCATTRSTASTSRSSTPRARAGAFHLDVFGEDGDTGRAAATSRVVPYSQAGVNDTDLFTPDPSKRYIIKASSTSGMLQAYASVLDRRNNDLVQVSDDTPRIDVAPGTPVSYYVSGVGRIEIPETNTHWRTDLSFYNPSSLPRDLILEYHYMPVGLDDREDRFSRGSPSVRARAFRSTTSSATILDDATPDDLKTGTILGLLEVSYNAPTGRGDRAADHRRTDLRRPFDGDVRACSSRRTPPDESVAPASGVLVMPGAQANLRFRTNIGIFSQGDLPTSVRVTAVRQDGSTASTFDYQLNNPDHTGAFAQIPLTEDTFPGIDGNAMTIRVQSLSGSPVGAYIVTVDQISADTVFIQGKRVN